MPVEPRLIRTTRRDGSPLVSPVVKMLSRRLDLARRFKHTARTTTLLVAVACGCILLAACATAIRISPDRPLPPLSASMAALAEPGPIPVSMQTGERLGAFGCTVSFETYRPDQSRSEVMVFLAHGFMRDLDSMRGWAAYWASYGLPVTVMSLCNSSWFAGHHDRNAIDMTTLAAALHTGPVLYAGFSAGGLAAYLAAASDRRTAAYLGLDTVESGDLAQNATRELSYPALFLLAEPSSCNADNNILDALSDVQGYRALRIRNSTHCHYEDPYDKLCESVCGYVEPPEAQEIVIQTVRSLATAWVLEQTLDDYSPSRVFDESNPAGAPSSEHVEVLR